jgi:hypothetical protein
MYHKTLGLADAIIVIAHEPPETTPLLDDEDVELGFCVGCCRLVVDEESSLEVDDEELVSDEVDDDVFEFEDEFVE